ncbi:hypothetical protein JCM6882_008238 [Rhodosporidiobolus microsporus]
MATPIQQQPARQHSATTTTTAAAPVDTHSSRVDVIQTEGGRVLCVADVRGAISTLNQLAAEHSAVAIIHSGDFGFYEPSSLPNISDRTLKHLVQYSSLISPQFRSQLLSPSNTPAQMRDLLARPPKHAFPDQSEHAFGLSEFPKLLAGELKLNVPVYTIWGACEDVAVLEKIRLAPPSAQTPPADPSKVAPAPPSTATRPHSISTTPPSYSIPNLTVLDEATTRVLLIGGVRLRLFGLGGAVVPHKLFDNGSGTATIAGGQGTMWTTMLQIGEIVDTAQKVYDPSETRVLISHASPGREGLLAQLALVLKADLTVSAGLHFRYGVSYNEFSVQHDPEAFKGKLEAAKKGFNEVWDAVKSQVEGVIDDNQRLLLQNALAVANRVPASQSLGGGAAIEETAWKNCWNWNLPDAAFGSLVLDIRDGRIGSELKSQGFNFAYRQNTPKAAPPSAPASSASTAPLAPPTAPSAALTTNAAQTPAAAPSPAPTPAASSTPSSFANNLSGRPNAANQFARPGSGAGGNHLAPHQRAPSGPRGGGRGGFAGHGGWGVNSAQQQQQANGAANGTPLAPHQQQQQQQQPKPAPSPSPAPAAAAQKPEAEKTAAPSAPSPAPATGAPAKVAEESAAAGEASGTEAAASSPTAATTPGGGRGRGGRSGGGGGGGGGVAGEGGRGGNRGRAGRSNGEWRGRGPRGKSGSGSGSAGEAAGGGAGGAGGGESKPATPAPAPAPAGGA